MWYNSLSQYFIKKSKFGLTIIAVYVDDLNLIGTPKELTKAANYLKKEFEMKNLGKQDIALACKSALFK